MAALPNSAEAAVVAKAKPGVQVHDMTGGWCVIVAKWGEHHATWYFHVNDDPRIRTALVRDAERRLAAWQAKGGQSDE